jgi:hypothetical protein
MHDTYGYGDGHHQKDVTLSYSQAMENTKLHSYPTIRDYKLHFLFYRP